MSDNLKSIIQKVLSIVLILMVGFVAGKLYYTSSNLKSDITLNEDTAPTITAVQTSYADNSISLSVTDIVKQNLNSIVDISTEVSGNYLGFGNYTAEGSGSGIIISKDGYILTNNHVVNDASNIKVTLHDKTEYEDVKVVGYDEKTDIAILKIDAKDLSAVILGDSSSLEIGNLAVVIGNPLGKLGGTVTNGIISALEREINLDGTVMNLIQTNAAINPGNSGGGLFDKSGNLVGIVVAKSSGMDVEGIGFAIPINDVKNVINDLIDLGYVRNRPFLGVELSSNASISAYGRYYYIQNGATVSKVIENSAAEEAGIKVDDIITEFNETKINSAEELISEIEKCKVNDKATLKITRDRKEITLDVTLKEYKGE